MRMNSVLSPWVLTRSYVGDSQGSQVSSIWESVRKKGNWKGAAIQRGLEPGSLRISIVRSYYQGMAVEDTAGWR
jgi:hypothetical protein